jgi:hypothetical protein
MLGQTHDRASGCPRGGFFQPFFAPPPPSQWNFSAASGTSRRSRAFGVSKVRFPCLLKCTTLTLNPAVYLWRVCAWCCSQIRSHQGHVMSIKSFQLYPHPREPRAERMKHQLCESYFLSRRRRFCEIFAGDFPHNAQ